MCAITLSNLRECQISSVFNSNGVGQHDGSSGRQKKEKLKLR